MHKCDRLKVKWYNLFMFWYYLNSCQKWKQKYVFVNALDVLQNKTLLLYGKYTMKFLNTYYISSEIKHLWNKSVNENSCHVIKNA